MISFTLHRYVSTKCPPPPRDSNNVTKSFSPLWHQTSWHVTCTA